MSVRRPAALAILALAASAPAAQAKAPRSADARHTAYPQASRSSSVDRGDAALGAGGAVAVLVAAGSAAGLTVRRRRDTGLDAAASA